MRHRRYGRHPLGGGVLRHHGIGWTAMTRDNVWIIQSAMIVAALFVAAAILGGVIFAVVHP